MDKKLQIHVLENISDHGGWEWFAETTIVYNEPARLRFKQSDFEAVEYFRATVMLNRCYVTSKMSPKVSGASTR